MRWLALVLAMSTPVIAAPVTGDVVGVVSRWTNDGSRIVTDATIRTQAGDVVVTQLGGTVDGLTMRTFPQLSEPLVVGMRVAADVHVGMDTRQVPHTTVDDVRVLAFPPGFVRSGPTKHGNPLYWESGCILLALDPDGTKEIAGDGEFAVIDASIATWNDANASCTYMNIMDTGKLAQTTEVGRDGVNLLKFRDESWCRPAVDGDDAKCYPQSAAGLTTAIYVDDGGSRDGAIVDADIEINGKYFAISVDHVSLAPMIPNVAYCRAELQNTLTHELGHLQGLEHTCRVDGDPERVDGNGDPVPLCANTSDPAIVEATMYPFQDCDETKKEVLTPDDEAGVCTIYPESDNPHECKAAQLHPGCCNAGGSAPPVGLALFVLLAWRRRK